MYELSMGGYDKGSVISVGRIRLYTSEGEGKGVGRCVLEIERIGVGEVLR